MNDTRDEPPLVERCRRVVERVEGGERFLDDADVRAVLEGKHLQNAPYPAVDDDDWNPPDGWPERKWLIPRWLPVGRLGMLSGRGGRGKSRLALQLAGRLAGSRPLGGVFVPPAPGRGNSKAVADEAHGLHELNLDHAGPVVYASWEDEREEVGRRLAAMGQDNIVKPADLHGRLRFLDLRRAGSLWGPDTSEGGSSNLRAPGALTAVGQRVRATCEEMKAVLLIIDSLAGAYANDENVRPLVRAFCADWDGWASATGCTVMLIAHPPKTPSNAGAEAVDQDYAGSTDWHNAARWRWALHPVNTGHRGKFGDGKAAPVRSTAVTVAKSSYGPDGGRVFLASSPSKLGWHGVSPERAAELAALERSLTLTDEVAAVGRIEEDDPNAILY